MKLFINTYVMSMLRRQAWMKWFPPMAVRSPSPLYTTTLSSGFASFRPVANGIARPCVVWKESRFRYPATLPEQPIPETTATLSRSSPLDSSAWAKQLTVVPIPHPGHQMWGMRSMRRNASTGLCGRLVSVSLRNTFSGMLTSETS